MLELTGDQVDLLIRYFEMLHKVASERNHYNRHIARALTSAAAYQVMAFGEAHTAVESNKNHIRANWPMSGHSSGSCATITDKSEP